MNQEKYGDAFFKNRHQKTVYSAETILGNVLQEIPEVNSAVDFGCGVGTWLSVLNDQGVTTVQGYDGFWVNTELLEIPAQCFTQVNLEESVALDRRFDLAISLEVAEHLQPGAADTFVETLTSAADFVLFSAAIPAQGGNQHVNEQWQQYWCDLFEKREYQAVDLLRTRIWNDNKIPIWYRQNILLFVQQERMSELKSNAPAETGFPVSVVHPEMYQSKVEQMETIKGTLKAFRRTVRKWIRKAG